MQKQYNRQIQQNISKELADLRKGGGLAPARLRNKITIRVFVSRLSNVPLASLTESQMYAFIVKEINQIIDAKGRLALKNALGIDHPTTNTLSARRQALAIQLNKHPDTIERYENQGLSELAARLSDPFTAPSSATPLPTVTYTQHLEEQVAQARAATVLNLSGLLSLRQGADELVHYLESLHKPYLNTSISISFHPSIRGTNWYKMDVQFIFQGRRDTFRMAVVTANEDGERLMKQGLIDEFQKLNDNANPVREIRAVINNSSFTMQHPHTGKQKLLRFRELAAEYAAQLLQSVEGRLTGMCRLIEVVVPPEWQDDEILYKYSTAINLRDDIHYAYWYAPSMMFVKKFTFDYTNFPDREKWQFIALPFLGHIAGDVFNRSEHSFTLYPNSWLMPGHGIGLMWEEG